MGSMAKGLLAARKAGIQTASIQLGPTAGRVSVTPHGRTVDGNPTFHAAIVETLAPSTNVAPKEPCLPDE